MLTRIISALVGVPIFLYIIYKGSFTLKCAVLIISVLGVIEFFKGFNEIHIKPSKLIGISSCGILFLINILGEDKIRLISLWIFIIIISTLVKMVMDKKFEINDAIVTIAGILYVAFLINHIALLGDNKSYTKIIWIMFIIAWSTDTCAYFVGYLFGKNKLCPNISPKKTIEGAIGGIVGSILASGAYAYFIMPTHIIDFLILGCFGSILGQIGDLAASMFKRYCGIKDYGKIMPGHGGVLDRFDSILFVAPIIYYYTEFFY